MRPIFASDHVVSGVTERAGGRPFLPYPDAEWNRPGASAGHSST